MAFLSASEHYLPHSPSAVCLAIKAEWTPLHVSVSTKDLWISEHQIQTFTWTVISIADKEHKHFRILLLRKRSRVRHIQHRCLALILCPPKSGRAALLAPKVLRGFLSRFPGRASPGDQMSVCVWEHTGTTSLWLVLISVINTRETAPPHFQWLQVSGVSYQFKKQGSWGGLGYSSVCVLYHLYLYIPTAIHLSANYASYIYSYI